MQNIVLIGSRSVGKSSVGEELAKKLSVPLIKVDEYIEQHLGNIREFASEHGADEYRLQEHEILKELCSTLPRKFVLTTGGGTVASQLHKVSDSNAELLKEYGVLVHLNPSKDPEFAAQKLFEREKLRKGDKNFDEIQELHMLRINQFAKIADYTVNVESLTPKEVSAQILEILHDATPLNTD